MPAPSVAVLEALAVTAEITGTQLSPGAARVFANDLARYPEEQILAALMRCRREVRNRLTVADVLGRLDDGRPSADEAYAMLPQGEDDTVVWTEEMTSAWAIASEADDRVARRMAFLSCYRQAVQRARDEAKPVKWAVSIGTDPRGREHAIQEAVRRGRIGLAHAESLLPGHSIAIAPAVTEFMKKLTIKDAQ